MARDFDVLVKRVREIWVLERRLFELRHTGITTDWGDRRMTRWDGGTDAKGIKRTSVWLKIAELCIKHDVDAETLVRAMFHRATYAPNPNQATGAYGLGKYQLYISAPTTMEMKNEIFNKFEFEKSCVSSEVSRQMRYFGCSEGLAWRVALGSNTIALSPLFRYCVSKNQNWEDLAVQYFDAAKCQYKRHVVLYNEVWGDWLPADFKITVKEAV